MLSPLFVLQKNFPPRSGLNPTNIYFQFLRTSWNPVVRSALHQTSCLLSFKCKRFLSIWHNKICLNPPFPEWDSDLKEDWTGHFRNSRPFFPSYTCTPSVFKSSSVLSWFAINKTLIYSRSQKCELVPKPHVCQTTPKCSSEDRLGFLGLLALTNLFLCNSLSIPHCFIRTGSWALRLSKE